MPRKPNPVPKWSKAPDELTTFFAAQLERLPPGVEPHKMFGYLCGFVNGNMFAGIFQDGVVLRLSPEQRERIVADHGAKPFVPIPGRPMREYVETPQKILDSAADFAEWLGLAYSFAAALPPKEKKAAKGLQRNDLRGTEVGDALWPNAASCFVAGPKK